MKIEHENEISTLKDDNLKHETKLLEKGVNKGFNTESLEFNLFRDTMIIF